jgi:hypothetical protein
MTTKKENLTLLLQFISHLLKDDENAWFHDELALLITKKIISEKDSDLKLSAVTIKEMGSIDKYIENGLIPLIDYNGIRNERIRYTLIRDCVEMGKYRFSHFGKIPSFMNFCEYAFFQIEQLTNYYILERSGDFNNSIEYIKKYNPKASIDGKNNISSIAFSIKIWAIQKQTSMSKELKGCLDKISHARNEALHRTPEPEIEFSIISEKNKSIPRNKDLRTPQDWEIINKYNYLKFIIDRDYDLVTASIHEYQEIIIKNLNT